MKKQILVIGTARKYDGERQPLAQLVAFQGSAMRSARDDVAFEYAYLDDLLQVLDTNGAAITIKTSGEDISAFDFVWLRGRFVPVMNEIAIVAEYLLRKKVNFANDSYAYRSAFGKLAQMHVLSGIGLPFPKTVYADRKYAPEHIMANLTFPLIIKDDHGGHGEKNYLVQDQANLKQIFADDPTTSYIAQEFIPNDSDYRILIAGDDQLIIRRRGKEGSHLNNTSQGGGAELVSQTDFDPEVLRQAKIFAQALHYDVSGVDVMFHKVTGEAYFLEANSQPQLISGAYVEEKSVLMAKYFRQRLG